MHPRCCVMDEGVARGLAAQIRRAAWMRGVSASQMG